MYHILNQQYFELIGPYNITHILKNTIYLLMYQNVIYKLFIVFRFIYNFILIIYINLKKFFFFLLF